MAGLKLLAVACGRMLAEQERSVWGQALGGRRHLSPGQGVLPVFHTHHPLLAALPQVIRSLQKLGLATNVKLPTEKQMDRMRIKPAVSA